MVVNLVGDEKLENRTADATYICKVAQDFHPLLDAELGTPQMALMVYFKGIERDGKHRFQWGCAKKPMVKEHLIDIRVLLILRYGSCTVISLGWGELIGSPPCHVHTFDA